MQKPNFFIVGAPKCGTTAMHAYLATHREVFLATHKEPHFFGSDLEFRDRIRPTEPEYLGLFADARQEHRIRGEASVFCLYSRHAAREIREFSPDARILIMLRNPVDVMHSFHSQRIYNGTEDLEDFEQALAAEERRRRGRDLPQHVGFLQGVFYRDLVSFSSQVERYFEVYPRSNVHVILYDDFKRDVREAYRVTCDFLGIEPDMGVAFETVNPNKVTRSPRLQRLLADPPSLVRGLARGVLRTPALRVRFGSTLRRLNTRFEPRRPLDPGLRRHLLDEFAPEVERLGSVLGRDLSHWLE